MAARPRLTRAEQQQRTRAALLDAAAKVFARRGFAGASVEAITAEAGYTRGAFYSNFHTKEQLFAELLQERVYASYRRMAESASDAGAPADLGEVGERLARMQADPEGRWLFRLWLELLAHAGRDRAFRGLAADFWRGTRNLMAEGIRRAYEDAGREPPLAPEALASGMIALDIGLAVQHFADPKGAPLELYPDLYRALFEHLAPDQPDRRGGRRSPQPRKRARQDSNL